MLPARCLIIDTKIIHKLPLPIEVKGYIASKIFGISKFAKAMKLVHSDTAVKRKATSKASWNDSRLNLSKPS